MSTEPSPELLDEIVESLRVNCSASRATIRLCRSDGSAQLVAEALAEDALSMRGFNDPAVVAAPTYQFLAERQEILVQDDTRNAPVAPPDSLVDHFDVLAQMLAPVTIDGTMVATISVHEQGHVRAWSDDDVARLARARAVLTEEMARAIAPSSGTAEHRGVVEVS